MGSALTVRIVSYNHRRYLADALDGVTRQTRRPDVVTVTDDCSPNDDEETLRDIVSSYAGFDFERTPTNLGAVAQFRRAVHGVSTPYYMLHAADDALTDKSFLADAVDYLEANPTVIAVHGRTCAVDANRNALDSRPVRRSGEVLRRPAKVLRKQLARANVVPAVCVVIRTEIHQHLPPFPIDNPLCHDWQQWYLMTYFGDFAVIDRTVMDYRVHGANLSMGDEQRRSVERLWLRGYQELLSHPLVRGEDRWRLQVWGAHQRAKRHRIYRASSRCLTQTRAALARAIGRR